MNLRNVYIKPRFLPFIGLEINYLLNALFSIINRKQTVICFDLISFKIV